MVFEALISPWNAERRPWEMFFFGFLYASVSLAISLWIFESHAGLVSVFLTVMLCIPLIYGTLRMEEEKIDYLPENKSLIREHARALWFFLYLFVGMTLAFATWFVVMPAPVSQAIFSVQLNTILDINGHVTSPDLFQTIFINNIKVLAFSLLFSFFFGAGVIFILAWNASVIAAAMGGFIKTAILNSPSAIAPLSGYTGAMLRYFLHGIPEIAAYFVAALAGGIISTAIVRKDITTKNFQRIAIDTSNLILISVVILLVAGLIEAYVTPYFY